MSAAHAASPRLASFDVFDTVLTRACASPSSVFLLVGRAAVAEGLLPAWLTPAAFAEARTRAEALSRDWARAGECTLAEVYAQLGFSLGLAENARTRLAELEMDTERRLLAPVPAGAAMVERARAEGARVAFVSDTYLPSSFVGALLRQHGLMREGDLLLVSCEAGASKYGGTLFPVLLERAGVPASACVHTGDNPRSDVAMAGRHGIQARHFTDAHPTPAEAAMDAHAAATGGLASLFAGASRASRLSLGGLPERERRLAAAGAQFAGPLLSAYCLWLLARARARGIRRLYLLSRDGEVLIEVCRELCRRLGWEIELRYLYASRQGWHLPGVVTLGPKHRSWLLERTDSSTPRRMLSRVDIEPERFEAALAGAGLPRDRWEVLATPADVKALDAALSDPALKAAIERNAAERRAVVVEYFRQEGLLDGVPWAMVDVGWHGRLQHSLASILSTCGGPTPTGFYMGLRAGAVEPGVGDMEAWLFDARHHAGRRFPSYEYDAMVEVFCAATHGTLRGYTRTPAGRVEPVLKEARNAGAMDWGLERFREGVRAFAASIAFEEARGLETADLRPMARDVLRTIIDTPRREDALALASFPFDTDQSGDVHAPLGRPLTASHVWTTLAPGGRVIPAWAFWKAGSFALSPWPLRVLVGAAADGRELARRIHRKLRGGPAPEARAQPAPAAAVPPAPQAQPIPSEPSSRPPDHAVLSRP